MNPTPAESGSPTASIAPIAPIGRWMVSLIGLLIAVLAGCGSDAEVVNDPVFALDRAVAADIVDVETDRVDVLPAPLVRSVLQDLLTEHSDLSIEVMREAVDDGVRTETLEAITRNTDQLTLTIGVVYGPEGAAAFDQLWTHHIEFFNDYAAALEAGDGAAAKEAIAALGHYEHDFSSYIDEITSGEAGFDAVLAVLGGHVDDLVEQADAWAAGDYALGLELATHAHRHMDVIADALALGIARQDPAAFPGNSRSGQAAACASAQLDRSVLLSARLAVVAAERNGDPEQLAAAAAQVAELESLLGSSTIDAVDAAVVATSQPDGSTEGFGDPHRSGRDHLRASLATGDCGGSVLP